MLKLIRRTAYFVIFWDILISLHLVNFAILSANWALLLALGLIGMHGVFFIHLHNQVKDKLYQDQNNQS